MVTDVDHIQSLRNRLLQKMRANEAENAEIQEMLRLQLCLL